jgi:hypothetical protein
MTSFFPIFVEEGDNNIILEDISKEKLQVIMHSFHKDKISGPYHWTIKFFLGWYDVLEDDLLMVIE